MSSIIRGRKIIEIDSFEYIVSAHEFSADLKRVFVEPIADAPIASLDLSPDEAETLGAVLVESGKALAR